MLKLFNQKITWILLSLFGVIITWSLVVPIFEFPDEQAHVESVEFLATNSRMPHGEEWDMTRETELTQKYLGVFRDSRGINSYTYHPEYHVEYTDTLTGKYESEIIALRGQENRDHYIGQEAARYPRLYYDFLAFWFRLVSNQDIILRTFILRLGNSLVALLTAFVVYRSGLLLFSKKSYAITLAIMVMVQPMYSFLSAGVNSDNLHNLLFAAVIYGAISVIKNGINLTSIIGLGLVSVIDIFTKPQGFVAIPLIVLAIILRSIKEKKWKLLIWGVILVIGIILLGFTEYNKYIALIVTPNIRGVSFVEYLHFSGNKLYAQNLVWYWGVFKWLGLVLPPIYWRVANRVVLLSIIGILIYVWKILRTKRVIIDPYSLFFMFSTSIIYAIAIYWFDWQYNKSIGYSIGVQARYFFPTILAHMTILFTGIVSLGWNNLTRLWLRRGLITMFVWLQVGGIWRLMSSYYDLSSLESFITEASQYKPWFAKGDWWYLWGLIYLGSLVYLAWRGMKLHKKEKLLS